MRVFLWVGFLLFVRAIGDEEYQKVLERSGGREVHERLLEVVGGGRRGIGGED